MEFAKIYIHKEDNMKKWTRKMALLLTAALLATQTPISVFAEGDESGG